MPLNHNRLEELQLQLKTEIEHSILLEPADRQFWLENLPSLPLPILQNVLDSLKSKNQQVDTYINLALAQDQNQEHLKSLKAEVKKIKQNTFKIEEKAETPAQQKTAEKLLDSLNQI